MLELIRARSATVNSLSHQVKEIVRALPSGYNRDFQETKEPLLKGFWIGLTSVRVMRLVIGKLSVNEKELSAGFLPEIFATDRALELVAQGLPFREAYRQVGQNLDKLQAIDALEAIEKKKYPGAPGNLNLGAFRKDAAMRRESLCKERKRVDEKLAILTVKPVRLYG